MKEDLKRIFGQSTIVGKYILVMVVLFLVLRILMFLGFHLNEWLSLPQDLGRLLSRPWTPLTYMFTHIDTRHIFWNMVLLWLGGNIFIQLLDEKRFIKTYWLGGLIGGISFLVVYNYLPSYAGGSITLLGASAAVLAVLVAATAFRPDHTVRLMLIGEIKLLYVTLIFLVLTLPLGFSNFGGDVAHLGGVFWGLFYGLRLKRGVESAVWFDRIAGQVIGLVGAYSAAFKKGREKKAKMKVYTSPDSNYVPRDDKEYNAMKKAKQEQVDLILEKISKSGYESLNAKEKAILFNASNTGKDA